MSVWPCKLATLVLVLLILAVPGQCLRAQSSPRVVTLTPHATEMVFAAGAGELIVATVNASDYPPQALEIPRFGDGVHTSLEEILRWQPDVIVGWPSTYTERLQQLGQTVLLTNPTSPEEIADDIERIGKRLNTWDVAHAKAQAIRQQFQSLDRLANAETFTRGHGASDSKPMTVIVLASADGRFVIGSDPLINEVIRRCAGINPFAANPHLAPQVGLEGIISTQPALIVSGTEPLASIRALAPLQLIHADWLYRPGPRFVLAALQLCEAIASSNAKTRQHGKQSSHN